MSCTCEACAKPRPQYTALLQKWLIHPEMTNILLITHSDVISNQNLCSMKSIPKKLLKTEHMPSVVQLECYQAMRNFCMPIKQKQRLDSTV